MTDVGNSSGAPASWIDALARSEADLVRGDVVTAQTVHDELRAAIVEIEAAVARASEPQTHEP